jgi:hypothetical protein
MPREARESAASNAQVGAEEPSGIETPPGL